MTHQYKTGDEVEVLTLAPGPNQRWERMRYLGKTSNGSYILGEPGTFKYRITDAKIRPVQKELTMQEIADKFNIPLTQLRIKK